MSLDKRISSLPLYTRNLHIFSASGHKFESGGTYLKVKWDMTVE